MGAVAISITPSAMSIDDYGRQLTGLPYDAYAVTSAGGLTDDTVTVDSAGITLYAGAYVHTDPLDLVLVQNIGTETAKITYKESGAITSTRTVVKPGCFALVLHLDEPTGLVLAAVSGSTELRVIAISTP